MNEAKSPNLGKMILQAAVPALVGAFLLRKDRMVAGMILCGIGALILLAGIFLPTLYRLIDRFGQALGRVAATALTWALLVPMFFLVFLPGRCILILRGIDPMCRRLRGPEKTYWVPRKPVADPAGYRRQF